MLDIAGEIVLSCEAGCAKPDPRICLTALDRLGAGPAAALFIDDEPGNVAAAEALGMTGHVHAGSVRTIARIAGFARASPRPP